MLQHIILHAGPGGCEDRPGVETTESGGGENGGEARRDREPFMSAVWTLQRLLYVLWKSMHAWSAFLAK